MRFNVNRTAVNHFEMASDTNQFTGLFLTNYCKALSDAFKMNVNFHKKMKVKRLRARGGLNSTSPAFFQKNRVLSLSKKYPVVIKHRELASSQPLIHILYAKV